MIRDVADLEIYRRSLEDLNFVYQLAKQIPESHRKLRRQIVESAEGVPPQIAEGFAKKQSILVYRSLETLITFWRFLFLHFGKGKVVAASKKET